MKIPLTKSKLKAADLDGQSVEFRLPGKEDDTMIGVGAFLAVDCPHELLSLSIVVDRPLKGGLERERIRIPITQIGVDCLRVHHDQKIARYSMLVV